MLQKDVLLEKINNMCETILKVPGVYNATIIQVDGYPLATAGVWLAEEEVFDLGAIVAAISMAAKKIERELDHILVEGTDSKIAIFNLIKDKIILAATTSKNVNLGAFFIQAKKLKKSINPLERYVDLLVKMPLIEFNENEKKELIERARTHNLYNNNFISIEKFWMQITPALYEEISSIINEFKRNLNQKIEVLLIANNAFQVFPLTNTEPSANPLAFSLFDISRKLLRVFRQEDIEQLMVSFSTQDIFIYDFFGGIIVIKVIDKNFKIGLIRFLGFTLRKKLSTVFEKHSVNIKKLKPEINLADILSD